MLMNFLPLSYWQVITRRNSELLLAQVLFQFITIFLIQLQLFILDPSSASMSDKWVGIQYLLGCQGQMKQGE